MQRVKERLVLRRHALNLSQEELAEKSGVSARAIAGYETGESMPTPRILQKLAIALDWKPEDFYVEQSAAAERDHGTSFSTSSTEVDLWRTRALAAEKKLEMVREGMRRLVEASADTRPLSSSQVSPLGKMAIETAERAVDRDFQESEEARQSGEHSGESASPSHGVSGASKAKHP